MVHELAVWMGADEIGTLSFSDARLGFSYQPSWLTNPAAMALSCSLPLRAASFEDRACRPYFAGLLPEGRLRQLIARQYQVSGQNDFALLNAIGGECAGAITFLMPEQQPIAAEQGSVAWLDEAQLLALLEELPRRPMLAGRDGMRLSLAGAQDKLPVVFDGKRIGLPKDGYPSTHILKPAIRNLEGSVLNESFCMTLANAMQLPAARAHIHAIKGREVLLVERYDRRFVAGRLSRLHQEDFCQALGVMPEMKYQNEGGPDLQACFDLLRRVTRPSALQVLRLLDYVILNALIGNHDAHAKNFSLLYVDATTAPATSPVVAPLYDVLCTAVYPELASKMAMKLGSKFQFSDVMEKHWDQFADQTGLSRAQTRKRVMRLAIALPKAAEQLQAEAPFANRAVVVGIVDEIARRCALTVRRLAGK